MDELMILRTFAAVTTVVAASLVAVNLNARVTVAGFIIFIVASIAWMADGWLEAKASLAPERDPSRDQRDRSLALAPKSREGSEKLGGYWQSPSRRINAL
jgi:hypothetical protein